MNFQHILSHLSKRKLQAVFLILFLLPPTPTFAILICNSPEYENALCSQSAEALKVFTAHLNTVKNDIGQCSNPPPSFKGIECEGEFPTTTCPSDAPAQQAFLDALDICNQAKEGGTGVTPESFGESPTGPGGTVTNDLIPPTGTQPPSTGSTASPVGPGNAIVVPPETSRPSIVTVPRDPNVYRNFIPTVPDYKVTPEPLTDEDDGNRDKFGSKPLFSDGLREKFRSSRRSDVHTVVDDQDEENETKVSETTQTDEPKSKPPPTEVPPEKEPLIVPEILINLQTTTKEVCKTCDHKNLSIIGCETFRIPNGIPRLNTISIQNLNADERQQLADSFAKVIDSINLIKDLIGKAGNLIGEKLGGAIAGLISGTKGLGEKLLGGSSSIEGLVITLVRELSKIELRGVADIIISVPHTDVKVEIYKVEVCFATTRDSENKFHPVRGFRIGKNSNPGILEPLNKTYFFGGPGGQQQREAKEKAAKIAGNVFSGYTRNLKRLEEFLEKARGISNQCSINISGDDLDRAPIKPDIRSLDEKCLDLRRKIAKKKQAIEIIEKKVKSLNEKIPADTADWSDKDYRSFEESGEFQRANFKLQRDLKKLEKELIDCLKNS